MAPEAPVSEWETPETTARWEIPEAIAIIDMPEDPTTEDQTKILDLYRSQAKALIPTDANLKSCALFEAQCKLAARRVEERRKALIEPHLPSVQAWRDINAEHNPVKDAFEMIGKAMSSRISLFIEDRRRAQEWEQARLNADATTKRAEEERNAEIARREAEKARTACDEVQAVQWEAQAEQAEMAAAEAATPAIVEQQAKTIDLGDSTLSYRKFKPDWNLPGWDRKEKFLVIVQGRVDHRLNGLIGNLKKLPDGLQWLLRFVEINPVLLNKACANEQFPAPFTMTKKPGGSMLRGGKE